MRPTLHTLSSAQSTAALVRYLCHAGLVLAALLLGSCKQNSSPEPETKHRLLSGTAGSKTWRAVSATTPVTIQTPIGPQQLRIDVFQLNIEQINCVKDNTYEFFVDKRLIIGQGTQLCVDGASQPTNARWDLNATQDTLLITGSTDRFLPSAPLPLNEFGENRIVTRSVTPLPQPITIPVSGFNATISTLDLTVTFQPM